ncbi:MAG: hypothetical protein ACTSYZ_15025 [Candidatus Helarchaeota archaeon]
MSKRKMPEQFAKFIISIAENTKFIRLDMIPFFEDYIKKHPTPLKRFKRAYKISRSKSNLKIVKSNVAAYLIKKGNDLFTDWLNTMFYFRKTDLSVEIKGGGTSMDVVINIKYIYREDEIKVMERVIKDYELNKNDITIEDICLLLLSEAILCMQTFFNEIIGYKFSLMVQNDEVEVSKNKINTYIELVTRLYS